MTKLWRSRKSQSLGRPAIMSREKLISTIGGVSNDVLCFSLCRVHRQVVKDIDGIWKVTEWLALGSVCHSDGATPQFSLLASARPESHSILVGSIFVEMFWDVNFDLLSCRWPVTACWSFLPRNTADICRERSMPSSLQSQRRSAFCTSLTYHWLHSQKTISD